MSYNSNSFFSFLNNNDFDISPKFIEHPDEFEPWDWTYRFLKADNEVKSSPSNDVNLGHSVDEFFCFSYNGEEKQLTDGNVSSCDTREHTKTFNSPLYLSKQTSSSSNEVINNFECLGKKIEKETKNKKSKKSSFECLEPGCDKVYRTKENLTLHFKNKHLKMKPYKCSFCSSEFSHRNGKIYHERKTHLNILPYGCDVESKLSFLIFRL